MTINGEVRTTSSTGGEKGVKLQRFDLIPVGPLTLLAEHYGRGANKYDDHQWRQGYEWSKTYAAAMRHLTAFWGGENFDTCPADGHGCQDVDKDGNPFEAIPSENGPTCYNHTGSHHLACLAWHAFAGLEFAERHQDHDDRYVRPLDEPDANPFRTLFSPRDNEACYELPCTHGEQPGYDIETADGPMRTLGCEDAEPGVRCFVVPGVHDESCPSYRGSRDYLQREVS